jgi:hypothetical protein
MIAALPSANLFAEYCFWAGVAMLVIGVAVGVIISFQEPPKAVTSVAKAKLKKATGKINSLQSLAVAEANSDEAKPASATTAAVTATEAKDLLSDIEGLLAALPERLRFAGLLVLIGGALMSVALVQFGGHSIF